jgi:hypothetical protein
MDGCAEEWTDKEWKWLTLVLCLPQKPGTLDYGSTKESELKL